MLDEAVKHIREAIMLGRTDIIKKLLEEVHLTLVKENPDDGDTRFAVFLNDVHPQIGTFLHEAVKQGKKDVVRALLQEGADPGAMDQAQETAVDLIHSDEMRQVFADVLLQATANDNIGLVERLLRAGIDVSSVDTIVTKNTPLHWAASFGSAHIAQVLLEQYGADPNLQNSQGMTPLHDAVIRGQPDLAKVLVKFGANPNVQGEKGKYNGKSVFDLAESKEEILAILKTSSYLQNPVQNSMVAVNGINNNSIVSESEENNSLSEVQINTPKHFASLSRMSPVPTVITDERFNLLWPRPKHIQQLSDDLNLFPNKMTLSVSSGKISIHRVLDVWDTHRSLFMKMGRIVHISETSPKNPARDSTINCVLNENLFSQNGGYKLVVSKHKIKIVAADLSGLHYAITTLVQLFNLFYPCQGAQAEDQEDQSETDDFGITSVAISDAPESPMRAVLLDLNPYGRVPKIEVLLGMVDIWSMLKINQFHCFIRVGTTEATFLCFSKSDFLTLDRYCRDRFINLVPAIDVDASVASLSDLEKLRPKIREILQCFDQPQFVHFGPKITSLLVQTESSVYNHIPIDAQETTVILCANSLHNAIEKLPSDVLVMHYGFQKQEAFTNALSSFVQDGLGVAICNGTFAWSNLAGNPEVAVNNAIAASVSLKKCSGLGVAVAHWSSHPSLAHPIFAWPGFLVGAGLSWNPEVPYSYLNSTLPELLDIHVFGENGFRLDGKPLSGNTVASSGRALLELGHAEASLDAKRLTGSNLTTNKNSGDSTLLRLLVHPDDVSFESSKIDDFAAAMQQIKKAQSHLVKSKPNHKPDVRTESFRQELQLTSEILLLSAKVGRALMVAGANPAHQNSSKNSSPVKEITGGVATINVGVSNLPPTFRTDIANKALSLVEQFRALWLSRYEPQGLQASLLVLSELLSKFIPENTQM